MVGGAEYAMYLYLVLNYLTNLSHSAHIDLPLVITEVDAVQRNALPVTALAVCQRGSSAGLI